tara:strand:+ start:3231 stop:3599 length:369 start_codon:yes stop_codon:yes gene_type:complete
MKEKTLKKTIYVICILMICLLGVTFQKISTLNKEIKRSNKIHQETFDIAGEIKSLIVEDIYSETMTEVIGDIYYYELESIEDLNVIKEPESNSILDDHKMLLIMALIFNGTAFIMYQYYRNK